jgi:uncharacterized protein (TIGR02996 family)
MIGLHVCLGRQRSKRFEIAKERVTIGSDASNDLVLRDGGVAPYHGALVRVRDRWFLSFPAPDPGGAERAQPLEDGARLQVGAYTLVLALAAAEEPAPRPRAEGTPAQPLPQARDPVEQRLLDALLAGDEASRLVYADWLEGRGDALRAEFLRLQRSLAGVDPTDPDERGRLKADLGRLRQLAPQIDLDWRRLVGRPAVEGCRQVTFDFPCKMDWGALAPTALPNVRRCHGCGDKVFYVSTIGAAREHASLGHCVAVDFGEPRRPGDLREPPRPTMMMGAIAMPPRR